MSRISDAMLYTLLEEITDYHSITIPVDQMEKLEFICDRWKDEESIESEINEFLTRHGYTYDVDRCEWQMPK